MSRVNDLIAKLPIAGLASGPEASIAMLIIGRAVPQGDNGQRVAQWEPHARVVDREEDVVATALDLRDAIEDEGSDFLVRCIRVSVAASVSEINLSSWSRSIATAPAPIVDNALPLHSRKKAPKSTTKRKRKE